MTAETHYLPKKLLTTAEVAAEYNVPLATLRYWIAQGTAPKSAKIGKRRMFRRADIDAWVDAQFDGVA